MLFVLFLKIHFKSQALYKNIPRRRCPLRKDTCFPTKDMLSYLNKVCKSFFQMRSRNPEIRTCLPASPRLLLLDYCSFFLDRAIHFRYALINGSMSPSSTASTFPVSSFVLWSFTIVYGCMTYERI